jgi:hypothetical protein
MEVIFTVLVWTIFIVIPIVGAIRGEGTKNNLLWIAVGGLAIWLLYLTMGWE